MLLQHTSTWLLAGERACKEIKGNTDALLLPGAWLGCERCCPFSHESRLSRHRAFCCWL